MRLCDSARDFKRFLFFRIYLIMDILLVRHTRVALDRSFCYGSSDVDLADTYPEDLERVRAKMPLKFIGSPFYSSPLKRCWTLAADLAGTGFQTDDRLVEFSFGNWELKKWSAIDRNELKMWASDMANLRVPGGDLLTEFSQRCNSFVEEISGYGHERIVVITHSGVINALLAKAMGIHVNNIYRLNVDYGGTAMISMKKGIQVVGFINR